LRALNRTSQYKNEHDLPIAMDLIDKTLSEPYSVFTYRYFLQQWPNLCYLAFDGDKPVGVIVCKMDDHRGHLRGYLAMLVVDNTYRGQGLGEQQDALISLAHGSSHSFGTSMQSVRWQCSVVCTARRVVTAAGKVLCGDPLR
jgi:GNAT superfamily N-acetyltransferase